jgi:PAS domain S-box-containing protein
MEGDCCMLAGIVITISALLQFAAAFVAFKLIQVTGKRTSWGLISLSIYFMAIRRSISLYQYVTTGQLQTLDFGFELLGLLVSALMFTGLLLISPLFQSMAHNILELQKAEEDARKREKKLNDITSHLAEGIYVFDERGIFSFMNQEAERLTGWTFEELKGEVVHNKIHHKKSDGSLLPIEECKMLHVIKSGTIYSSSDEIFTNKDGSIFPISVISSPIVENGKIVAVVTAFRDITQQKQLEKERKKLVQELQESLKAIKTLQGILPICSSCRRIRDDKGYWKQLEAYITDHSDAQFSHGYCPECGQKALEEAMEEIKKYKTNDTGKLP